MGPENTTKTVKKWVGGMLLLGFALAVTGIAMHEASKPGPFQFTPTPVSFTPSGQTATPR